MLDDDTLRQLRAQPLDTLVQSLERLHQARRDLPPALRGPPTPRDPPPAPVAAALRPAPVPPLRPAEPPAAAEVLPAPEQTQGERAAAGAPGAAAAAGDLASGLRSLLAEYEGLLRRYNEDFDRLFQQQHSAPPVTEPLVDAALLYGSVGGAPSADPAAPDAIVERLRRAQLLFLKFPIAAQAAFAAFVEEGRQYGKTVEGMRWKQALSRSPLLEDVSRVLSSLSLGALRESPNTVLPSAIADLLVSAASHPDLRELLQRAFAPKELG